MSVRVEEGKAVVSRAAGALFRAFLVMVLIATPSVLLPGIGADGKQMVALVALFAGLLTFVEYNATYPGLIEFRDAAPLNRVRFLIGFFTVFCLTVIAQNATDPSTMGTFVQALGTVIGQAMDFPYSPVRLATLMMASGALDHQVAAVRTAAGMAYLISLVGLSVFVVMIKIGRWPTRNAAFNIWVNLPTFDPSVGGDVVHRLDRDARVNIALGFLLPFLIPAVVKISSAGFEPLTLTSPQTLIWTMTAWAFLPASLFMRGIAMSKIADMVREKRRANGLLENSGYIAA
ncbi:hypothetical protein [Rhodobacter ferrooxidans]|uniref:Uncharacterized protein n=1 Tax=Rhodobacter ferrooxidans TaxID=371731 RepID=C8RWF2_9RHOB|nr:hypothetical protein [Rhodobacter sp. SW2]EEW26895.1 conserved hypothetical protein [Rhodobacter sp. SW2]